MVGKRLLQFTAVLLMFTGAAFAGRSNPSDLCGNAGQRCLNVVSSYQEAFGRDPSDGELNYWMQQGTSDNYGALMQNHRNWLRQDRGSQEGAVRESYMTVFGYPPNSGSGEMNYWVPQAANGLTYQEMVNAHMNWIRSDAGSREAAVHRSYMAVFGRTPDGGELSYWSGVVAQGGWNYESMVRAHTQYAIDNAVWGRASISAPANGIIVEANTGRLVDSRGVYLTPPSISALVAAGGGNLIGDGGGTLVAAGGGNLVAAGGGNLVAAGGGNITISQPAQIIAAIGNLVAAGGGNIIAAGGGNIIAAGGGNAAPTRSLMSVGQPVRISLRK